MTAPKKTQKPAIVPKPVENPRASLEHIEDAAFEAQVQRLTKARKWDELTLAFALHGSTLADRLDKEDK